MKPTFDIPFDDKNRRVTDLKCVRQRSSTGCQTWASGQTNHRLEESYSTPDIHGVRRYHTDFSYLKYPKSIACECDEHKERFTHDIGHSEIGVQVTAIDIQPAIHVQTTPSLLLRTAELPKRRPDYARYKIAHKCLDCCDCEEKHLVKGNQSLDVGTQNEMWLVSAPEFAQVGPSLTAVGPFCRLDYRLKTTKPAKDDLFFDCWAREPGDIIICSRNRDACSDFQQQVSALDINISELHLTENPEGLRELRGQVIYASSHPDFPGIFYKNRALMDCERSPSRNGKPIKRGQSFVTQVTQYDICPTKMIQTDVCLLPQMCIQSRMFQSSDFNCEYDPYETFPLKTLAFFNDFMQQVAAIDIGISEETQTCNYLSMMKPFRVFRSDDPSEPRGKVERHILTHRTRNIAVDTCDCKDLPADMSSTSDISIQASLTDISINRETQTSDQTAKLTKYYVRGEQWEYEKWS